MKTEIWAECGHNGNGNMRLNKEMIKEAAECGADVAKFQYYRIETIKKPYQSRYFELWASQLHKEDIAELAEVAEEVGIELMFSVFSADLVNDVIPYVERFKVASRSIEDSLLIGKLRETKKPIIASLGKWNKPRLPEFEAEFLYCVSDYPAQINANNFPRQFNEQVVGFSDHTLGLDWAKVAITRGAKIIEKHFTLSRDLPGYNQAGSMNPTELKELVKFKR